MRHVDYSEWAKYIGKLFSKADIEINDVLDISCGTGNLLIQLNKNGYRACGFDNSHEMVAVANKKLKQHKVIASVWAASMMQRSVRKSSQAVLCTYDSLNYCIDHDSCKMVITQVEQILQKGGLFIFDVSTVRNSRKHFQNYYTTETTKEFEYTRQSHYLIDKNQQINEFYITWHSDKKTCFKETHRQKIYRLDEISNVIMSKSMALVGVYDGFSRRPGSEKSERVHFVLKKVR
jgi:ubiquinone/menaquinone biosynthesis C-methylase UbiE